MKTALKHIIKQISIATGESEDTLMLEAVYFLIRKYGEELDAMEDETSTEAENIGGKDP